MEHELFDLPHREAVRAVATGAPVYLTVNPVEYHGPHLSLHNDLLVSRGLARDLHARLAARHPDWPLLWASDLEVGVEPCPGPGSRASRYASCRELVLGACQALAELGAKRVVLMTFHGAPLHSLALEAGVDLLRARGVPALSPLNVLLRQLLQLDDPAPYAPAMAHVADAAERQALLDGLRLDFHAGFFETSMALHYAPSSVAPSHRELPPCPEIRPEPGLARAARAAAALGRNALARELTFAALGVGWNQLRPFPGYTSRPSHARAEAGAFFASAILDLFAPVAESVLCEGAQPPAPIMAWLGRASLGGRLGALPPLGPGELWAGGAT
jgi:creatinine amidohydrolase